MAIIPAALPVSDVAFPDRPSEAGDGLGTERERAVPQDPGAIVLMRAIAEETLEIPIVLVVAPPGRAGAVDPPLGPEVPPEVLAPGEQVGVWALGMPEEPLEGFVGRAGIARFVGDLGQGVQDLVQVLIVHRVRGVNRAVLVTDAGQGWDVLEEAERGAIERRREERRADRTVGVATVDDHRVSVVADDPKIAGEGLGRGWRGGRRRRGDRGRRASLRLHGPRRREGLVGVWGARKDQQQPDDQG